MNKIKLAILVSILFYSCNGAEVRIMGILERKIESDKIKIDTVNKTQNLHDKEVHGRFDAKYPEGAKLSGQILNQSNRALANVSVWFRKKGEEIWKTFKSDSKGSFEIVNIEPAIYDLIFLAAGYSEYNLKDFSIISDSISKNEKLIIVFKKAEN